MLRQISLLSAFLLAITVSDLASAQTLPPEAKARILITKMNKALANKDNEGALAHLQEMNSLQVERPVSLYLVEAQLAGKSNKWTRSKKALDLYFQKAPPTDSGYDKAATLYVIAEEKEAAARKIAEVKAREQARLAELKVKQEDQALWLRAKNGGECGHIVWYIQESNDFLHVDDAKQHAQSMQCELKIDEIVAFQRTLPEMIKIPAGNFEMGSPYSEPKGVEYEGPQRLIKIDYDFEVSKYEVTWDQWLACVNDGGCDGYVPDDEGWGRGNRPVINVSWYDAKAYAKWLSDKTGHTYRFLSEAEWEYAARAGTTTPFSTGQRITTSQANFNGNYTYNSSSKGTHREKTLPVGSFSANAFGLYDMHGNVWEWVEDWYKEDYSHAQSNGSAFTNCSNCSYRVHRGGSWSYIPRDLRPAIRGGSTPSDRNYFMGFRLARTLP